VPVVVMTGHFPADVVSSRIEEFGVAEVLMKPVMITDLLNAVRRVVGPDQPG
jgi:FixJ family two-component response regulator